MTNMIFFLNQESISFYCISYKSGDKFGDVVCYFFEKNFYNNNNNKKKRKLTHHL